MKWKTPIILRNYSFKQISFFQGLFLLLFLSEKKLGKNFFAFYIVYYFFLLQLYLQIFSYLSIITYKCSTNVNTDYLLRYVQCSITWLFYSVTGEKHIRFSLAGLLSIKDPQGAKKTESLLPLSLSLRLRA